MRAEGLLAPLDASDAAPFDITREPLIFPVPRSAQLATMADIRIEVQRRAFEVAE